jgi:hypothetical protein
VAGFFSITVSFALLMMLLTSDTSEALKYYLPADTNYISFWVINDYYLHLDWNSLKNLLGYFALYTIPYKMLDWFGFWLVNMFLLLLISVYAIKINELLKRRNDLVLFLFFLNFYLMLSSVGANKEIILTLLTIMYVLFFLKYLENSQKSFLFLLIVISLITFFFRNGHGLIMLFFIGFWTIFKRQNIPGLIFTFIIGSLGQYFMTDIVSYSDILAHNQEMGVLTNISTHTEGVGNRIGLFVFGDNSFLYTAFMYFYKMVLNVASYATYYPKFSDNSFFYLVRWSFFIWGILFTLFTILAIKNYKKYKNDIFFKFMFTFFIFTLLGVSFSSYAHSRFMMPVFPLIVVLAFYDKSISLRV